MTIFIYMNHAGATWDSAITRTTADGISVGGYDIVALLDSGVPFTSVVHLLHTGSLPSASTARLLQALMVASIDHGPGTPSSLAARTVVSGGGNLQAAGAAGLLSMGDHHAAAVAGCMEIVIDVAGDDDPAGRAAEIVADRRRRRARIPGFGHRQHTTRDPRVSHLLTMARAEGVDGVHLAAAETMEATLAEEVGRNLPMNIDGVYAAVLAEIGVPHSAANAIFISSRIAGVLAHAVEELETQPPMRRIDPVGHRYSGPPPRSLNRADTSSEVQRQDPVAKGQQQ